MNDFEDCERKIDVITALLDLLERFHIKHAGQEVPGFYYIDRYNIEQFLDRAYKTWT